MTLYATAGAKLFIGGPMTSVDDDLSVADFSGQTALWKEIKELDALGTLGDTSQAVTASIINRGRDYLGKGTRSAGTMEVVANLVTDDPGQLAVIAAERTAYDYAFRLELPDAPPADASAVTITIASPGVITWTGHDRVAGDKVKLSTTGALPTGLTAGTTYYVVNPATNTFGLAATPGGTPIVTSGTQSGTHTATTIPTGSQRLFAAKVMSASEAFDQANSLIKMNMSLGVNSNVVRIDPTGA